MIDPARYDTVNPASDADIDFPSAEDAAEDDMIHMTELLRQRIEAFKEVEDDFEAALSLLHDVIQSRGATDTHIWDSTRDLLAKYQL